MDLKQQYRYVELTYEEDERIAVVTMNRPEKRNALSLELMRELIAAFDVLASDSNIAAVILRGAGSVFSAGHDLRELQCTPAHQQDASRAAFAEIFDVCVQLMERVQSLPAPVIAEVAGVATAAGCQLVATCDLAIASQNASFATPGVRIGLFCSTPMVALTRAIGRKRSMEMLLTGEAIDAPTAAAWGLVNHVVAPERLHEEAVNLARRIGRASGTIVRLGKRAFYEQIDRPQPQAYRYAKEVMTANALEPDAQEGMAAFVEKRPAIWRK